MNSLVFIEKEIKRIQLELDKETGILHQFSRSRGERWLYEARKEIVEKIQDKLNIFQQIKVELEAWETVKDKVIIRDDVILMRITDEEDEFESLKKLLESRTF